MPRYRCVGVVTGSKYLGVVEAATEEEAIEKAFDELDEGVSLCHQCADQCETAEVTQVHVEEIGDDEED